MADQGEPKIIIDSDWKSQAQKEKERLASKEREASAKAKPAAAAGAGREAGAEAGAVGAGGEGLEGEMPAPDFMALVGTLVTQALLYLGGFPDPQTGRAVVSLEHARFHIDLLSVLQEKTKGNLNVEEEADLNQALNELRLRFVEISRVVTQMQMRQATAGGGPGAGAVVGGPGGVPDLRVPGR